MEHPEKKQIAPQFPLPPAGGIAPEFISLKPGVYPSQSPTGKLQLPTVLKSWSVRFPRQFLKTGGTSTCTAQSLSNVYATRWRRKWQPTPVFLPGESQGRGSLVGFRLWGRTESDTTEAT